MRESVLEAGGFRAKFAELEIAGRWTLVEESAPFRAFAVAEPEVTVRAFVFRVLAERLPIDVEALRKLTDPLPTEPEPSVDIIRRMRDEARY